MPDFHIARNCLLFVFSLNDCVFPADNQCKSRKHTVCTGDAQCIQMENGQVLRTEGGYAELLLAPDTWLRLGENASLRMRENNLHKIQIELHRGSALIEILMELKTNPIRMYVSKSVVELKKDGLYRIDAEPPALRIYGGDAIAGNDRKKRKIKNSRMFYLDGERDSLKFDVYITDDLHQWSARRSYTLHLKNLLLLKPLRQSDAWYWSWKAKPEGLYNAFYRLTVPYNEDWYRYQQAVGDGIQRLRKEDERVREALPRIGGPPHR